MPATQLDPKCALIVVDLQKGIVGLSFAHPITDVIAKTRMLLDAFRKAEQTVVLVNVASVPRGRTNRPRSIYVFPADQTEVIAEMNAQPGDILITKNAWGAFLGTDLDSRLKSAGVTHVVLTGVATSVGVESTAREAYALGFNVTLAIDAMTDSSDAAHVNSMSQIFPKLGETDTSQKILNLLTTRSA